MKDNWQNSKRRKSSVAVKSKRQIMQLLEVPNLIEEHEKQFERRQFERDSRREIIIAHLPESIRSIKSVRMLFNPNSIGYVFNPTKMWEKLEATHYSTFYRLLQEKLPELKMKEDAYFEERDKRNRTSSLKKKRHNATGFGSFKNSSSVRSQSTNKKKLEPSSSKKLGSMNNHSVFMEHQNKMSQSNFDISTRAVSKPQSND